LKSQALKVARAIDAKEWKMAMELAGGFADAKADPAVLKVPPPKFSLEEISSPFRAGGAGGLNMDRELRLREIPASWEVAELFAVRTLVLVGFHPERPRPADRGRGVKEWSQARLRTLESARELLAVAMKGGETVDPKVVLPLVTKLAASCASCHPIIDGDCY
jgi:hypothetical protein